MDLDGKSIDKPRSSPAPPVSDSENSRPESGVVRTQLVGTANGENVVPSAGNRATNGAGCRLQAGDCSLETAGYRLQPPVSSLRQALPHCGRLIGVLLGLGTQLLFVWTVWHLFFFLRDGQVEASRTFSPLSDLGLSLQYALPHSLLLWPPFAKRLKRIVPPEFYGCFYCAVTCICLMVLFHAWTASPVILWELTGGLRITVQVAFFLSWIALFYSLSLSGLGYQTGLTPWWAWVRHRPQPRRTFVPRGAYRWFRHPIYLSFLGLIWFTPRMTIDHAILTTVWTIYIFVGSYLKDERLAYYLGESYRAYQTRVPGYPLIGFGPLGRRPVAVLADGTTAGALACGDPARKAA